MNLFNVVNNNFFNPLSSESNNRIYSDVLLKIYDLFEHEVSYKLSRQAIKDTSFHKAMAPPSSMVCGNSIITLFRAVVLFFVHFKDLLIYSYEKNGFSHRQGSGYLSKNPTTETSATFMIKRMSATMPWLKSCVRRIDLTIVGDQHDLTGILNQKNSSPRRTGRMDERISTGNI